MAECSRRGGVGSWVCLWFHTVMGGGGRGGGEKRGRDGGKRGRDRGRREGWWGEEGEGWREEGEEMYSGFFIKRCICVINYE